MVAHVVTGAAVRVTVPTQQKGIWEARILKRGDLVPGNVRKTDVAWLVERGFIAEVEAEAEKVEEKEASPTGEVLFNPAEHKAEDVIAYLSSAEEGERARVLAAEAEGKDRKGIREWKPDTAADDAEADGDVTEGDQPAAD